MKNLNCDLAVFGYGRITNHLIYDILQDDKKIVCITDYTNEIANKKTRNKVQFVSRKEIAKIYLSCDSALFAWKDLSRLASSNQDFRKWLFSESFNCKHAIHLSSASVYHDKTGLIDESENNSGIDAYSNDKYLLEKTIAQLMRVKLGHYSNLRISNVYGLDLKYGFIASLFNSIRTNDPAKIFVGREILRDYISVQDVSFAVRRIITSQPPNKVINVSTGIATSISEVLRVFSNLGFTFDDAIKVTAGDSIKNSLVLDCTLLAQLIDWRPRALKQEIESLLKFSLQSEHLGGI